MQYILTFLTVKIYCTGLWYGLDKSNHSLYNEKNLPESETFSTSRLSTWAITGIVVGSIVGVTLLGGGSYWLIKNKG